VENKDKWLIVTTIGMDIKRYPAIFSHLKQWQKELEKRWDKGNHWWELRPCDYYKEFEKPKIIYPEVSKKPRVTFDAKNIYPLKTCFVISSSDLYLLGILNSSLYGEYQKEIQNTIRGGYLMNSGIYLEKFPIPNASASDRKAIEKLVQKCLDAKGEGCEEWEKEIDERIAALYGL